MGGDCRGDGRGRGGDRVGEGEGRGGEGRDVGKGMEGKAEVMGEMACTCLIEGALKQLSFKKESQLPCHIDHNLFKHLYQQASLQKSNSRQSHRRVSQSLILPLAHSIYYLGTILVAGQRDHSPQS